MKPPKSILDRSFRYMRSHETDVAATFKRIRRELQQKLDQAQRDEAEARAKTVPIRKVTR